MCSLPLLGLYTFIRITHGFQTAVFAVPGDSVDLPCPIPSVGPCSEVNWNVFTFVPGFYTEVVRAGLVTADQPPTMRLGAGCSLHIDRLEQDSARTYVCSNGRFNASLSLEILSITSEKKGEMMEIHCYLNDFQGHVRSCPERGILLEWLSEDNTALNTQRVSFESPSKCFSKIIFKPRPTDHRRTWRCQLRENDTVKTSLGYTLNITDGIQEVFALVGELVSFSCDASSIAGGLVQWVGPLPTPDGVRLPAVTSDKPDFSLAVSQGQAGDYQCSPHGDQSHHEVTKVLATVRLHTLHVSAEQEGGNLTLSCVLTCAPEKCDQDVTLGWTTASRSSWLRGGNHMSQDTITSRLSTEAVQLAGAPTVCSVHRDGVLMASETWRCSTNTAAAAAAAWAALPLSLLLCAAVGGGGLYFHSKKNTEKGSEAVGTEPAPLYEVIPDGFFRDSPTLCNLALGGVMVGRLSLHLKAAIESAFLVRLGSIAEALKGHLTPHGAHCERAGRLVEDRPEGDRAEGDRAEGDRPEGGGPEGDRPEGDGPEGDRVEGDRVEGDRVEGDRPEGGGPEGDRPEGDRPEGDRPEGDRAEGDRPEGDRAEGDRVEGDRPEGDRPEGDRPEGDRPEGDRPEGDRVEGDRAEGDRAEGDRPEGDRAEGDRPEGDRAERDRVEGDRAEGDGPEGERGDTGGERGREERGQEL
ncbi:unnamed protein product [Boreogadus saida]